MEFKGKSELRGMIVTVLVAMGCAYPTTSKSCLQTIFTPSEPKANTASLFYGNYAASVSLSVSVSPNIRT